MRITETLRRLIAARAPEDQLQTAAIAGGNKETAPASYKEAVPVIDTLVNKQIIHRNKAARHKSRLAARIRAMQ